MDQMSMKQAPLDVPWLLEIATSDPNEDNRRQAIIELQEVEDEGVIGVMKRIALDGGEDEFVRRETIFVLENAGDDRSLVDLVVDEDLAELVRMEALIALSRLGTQEARRGMEEAALSERRSVRRLANRLRREVK